MSLGPFSVPQALLHLGLLRYDDALLARLRAGEPLPPGDPAEVAIRAGSVQAVEALRAALAARGRADLHAVLLDFFLWDYAKAHAAALAAHPIHHTRSIWY